MENEIKQAIRLLQAQRAIDRDEQPLSWLRNRLSSQAGSEYTSREVNKVLAEIIEADGSVGVVKALLALGADVNFVRRRNSSTWNKLTQRNYPGERSNILLRATLRCRPETVHALAAHADQANLDSVLHHAIARGNLAVLAALLEHGASPVQLHDDFQDVVYHDQVELLRVLLSGHHLPCLACRSTGLRIAVENRSQDVIRLLLDHWADVNYGDGIALIRAVELSRPDLFALLISGPVRPSPRSLDSAAGKAWALMGEKDGGLHHQMLELCLSAGATGPETTRLVTEGLVDVVRRRQINLVETLLRHKRPPSQYEAIALVEAVRCEDLDVVAKLLEFKPSASSLTIAVSQALSIGSSQFRYEVTRLLIEAGAQGSCAAEALVKTVHCLVADLRRGDKTTIERDMRLFYLLLHEGKADVDFGNGEALQIAARSASIEVAEEIVAKGPSPDSLGAALSWAMDLPAGEKKQRLVGMLVRRQVNEEAAGKALVDAFKLHPENAALVELLLTRASVNHNNGEVFIYGIRNFRPETFHLLLSQGIEYKALFTAVLEALKAPRPERRMLFVELLSRLQLDHLNTALKHVVLEEGPDLALVKILLDSGAEATYDSGLLLKHAACNLDLDLLRLLSQYSGHSGNLFSQAFAAVISCGKQWIAFEHVELIEIMLRHGASGYATGRAMVDIVDYLSCQKSRADLAGTLLGKLFAANVDVNYENGKAISIAASRGDPFLLSYLLVNGATSSSATLALTAAIMAHHDEKSLLRLIDIFADQRSVVPNFNRSLPGMPPPIFLCLKSYGKSVAILHRLVKAGCQMEATVPTRVCPDMAQHKEGRVVETELEPASVLMWALLQEEGVINPAVVRELVRLGADVSYTTPRSLTTPLLVAVRSGRVGLVQILLESGARVSAKDAFGRSALFYASRAGDAELIALMLRSKPPVNDGSLHEASRGFHVRAMKLLLEAGHDPNYRSSKHGGRTALGEIAFKASPSANTAVAKEALDLLSSVDASPLLKVNGKTVIFLSLDNQHNEAITRLLLDRVLYRTLNSHENTYQQGAYHYSPTMYISKGLLLGPPSSALLQLLYDHGCEDRFYASITSHQPPDAINLPDDIRDYERSRLAQSSSSSSSSSSARHTPAALSQDHAATSRVRPEHETTALAATQIPSPRHPRAPLHQQLGRSQPQRQHPGSLTPISTAKAQQQCSPARTARADTHAYINNNNNKKGHANGLRGHARSREAQVREDPHVQQQQQQHQQGRQVSGSTSSSGNSSRSGGGGGGSGSDDWLGGVHVYDEGYYEGAAVILEQGWWTRQAESEGQQEAKMMKMTMTELRTRRGNVIGQVDLGELRRWQASERGVRA